MRSIADRLDTLPHGALAGMRRGIEKESLRTTPDGRLALTPHPAALGSALTHPSITTDFSESQLELITAAHGSAEACLDELQRIHQAVYRAIGDERLWVASMPCKLPADETIPIGRYGSSNIGRAKSVYRMGLGYRYGRRMQTISGIHYNWSMPGLDNASHFSLIRNFRRHSFLLLLLYGASPAVCACFVEGRAHPLQPIGPNTFGLPHATSLRMGKLGYQSDAQSSLAVSYNSLETYGRSLEQAMTTPYPAYEAIGVHNPGGEYNQLATTLLQIENEFYGTIRPKRTIRTGERPLHALRERGVEYVEVRCMDLDPFEPLGIGTDTMRFIDVFLLHCLASPDLPDTPDEIAELSRNQHLTASRGRERGLQLERRGRLVPLQDWAAEILEQCGPIAERLDSTLGGNHYRAAMAEAVRRFVEPAASPSARVLAELAARHGGAYSDFVAGRSDAVREELLVLPQPAGDAARFAALAAESIAEQRRREAADTVAFETYRQQYLAPQRLEV
jgi:glutamate--cysteine ligase